MGSVRQRVAALVMGLGLMAGLITLKPGTTAADDAVHTADVLTTVAPSAERTLLPDEQAEPAPLVESKSLSIGSTSRGRLRNAVHMEESEQIRFKDGTPEGERFATQELVTLLERAAAHVIGRMPGARLTVGDLSRRRGGRLGRHRSHRSGRDADVVFYALDEQGQSAEPAALVGYRRSGEGRTVFKDKYIFDDARNWALISYLLTNDLVEVQRIFIARGLRRRLLARAKEESAPEALIERAEEVMTWGGGRHNDHFHLRIFCPENDLPRCKDTPPFYDWHPAPEP